MPRGRRPPGALHVWQPDSGEDEKPHQPGQRHLQVVSGSSSQRLSRGQPGPSRSLQLESPVLRHVTHFVFFVFCSVPGQEMVDVKRFIEKHLPPISNEWTRAAAEQPSRPPPFGARPRRRSVDSRNQRPTDNVSTLLSITPDRTGASFWTWRRMMINRIVSGPGAAHNPQC